MYPLDFMVSIFQLIICSSSRKFTCCSVYCWLFLKSNLTDTVSFLPELVKFQYLFLELSNDLDTSKTEQTLTEIPYQLAAFINFFLFRNIEKIGLRWKTLNFPFCPTQNAIVLWLYFVIFKYRNCLRLRMHEIEKDKNCHHIELDSFFCLCQMVDCWYCCDMRLSCFRNENKKQLLNLTWHENW